VLAVDVEPMPAPAGAQALQLDLRDADAADRVRAALDGPADVVLSDMAPRFTGHAGTDRLRAAALAESAYEVARAVLAPGGAFLCKTLAGGGEADLVARLKRDFAKLRHVKPPASRKESSELYLVATGFRADPATAGT
jgi:23S rRNA (uridine2552-2'-O)-methyltransferase